MKRIAFFWPLILVACGGSSDAEKPVEQDSIVEYDMNNGRLDAVDFNNELTMMQESMFDQVYVLFQSDSASVDQNLQNTLFEVDLNIQSLRSMLTPEGGEEFNRTLTNAMEFYRSELAGKFTEQIVPLLKAAELTKKQQDELVAYDEYFAEQEKLWFDSVFVAQDAFAKKSNIKLEE